MKIGKVVLGLALGLMVGAGAVSAQTFKVSLGQTAQTGDIMMMLPGVLYVHPGDTVDFTNTDQAAPHTVTFPAGQAMPSFEQPNALAPTAASGAQYDGASFLNTGILTPGQSFQLTFTKVGQFPYACILHPMMRGTIVVLPAEAALPSQDEINREVATSVKEAQLELSLAMAAYKDPVKTANADGSSNWNVALGVGTNHVSLTMMVPMTLDINVGDTVTWTSHEMTEPHFVMFNQPADQPMENGQGPGGLNPFYLGPQGGPTFDGTGYHGSGLVPPGASYSLKFTKAGTYHYVCLLHSDPSGQHGMVGTIVVH